MAKTITIPFEGREYTLEFTRDSVAQLERQNFNINEISDKPVTLMPMFFRGAFVAHHRNIRQEVVDTIFEKISNKQDLLLKLAEMYNDPIESMFDEPEESEGNLEWGTSW